MKQRLIEASRDFFRIGAVVAVVAAVSGVLFFHVWNQYRISELGYEIANVTTEHRELIERNRKLSIEVAVQGRTERMTVLAGERFGLEPIRPDQVRPLIIEVAENRPTLDQTEHAALVP